MSFISWQYALFLPGVLLLYWRLPHRGRIVLLIAASYFFYGVWDARFLALLLTSTTIDYFCGLAMAGQKDPLRKVILTACLPALWLIGYSFCAASRAAVNSWIVGAAAVFPLFFGLLYHGLWRLPVAKQRFAFLLLSVLTNLGVLSFFKYFNFFADTLLALFGRLGWHPGWTLPHIILPVAISFYTFQSISYSVEVYRGQAQPARDFLMFAAYLSFFPQLIAGPIERPNDLLPQFERPAAWNTGNVHRGLGLLLIGLFKKVFVGDNCALVANYAFDPGTQLNGYWAVLGVVAFAFQIYGDFSGYTDIARGSARLLGIRLNRNFHFPYFARGPSEFWQRWHITLSSWFRDYVYIALGGNRRGTLFTLRNVWIAMLLAGLWHGASWIFILWGAYHAALLTLYRFTPGFDRLAQAEATAGKLLAIPLMFTFTLVGWAIFRSQDLGQLAGWFTALGRWNADAAVDWTLPACWCLIHAVPLLLVQAATWRARDEVELVRLPWAVRGLVYLVLLLLVSSSTSGDQEFIYFQF